MFSTGFYFASCYVAGINSRVCLQTFLSRLHEFFCCPEQPQVGGAVREVTGYTATYRHIISVEDGGEEGDCLHIRDGYHHVIEGFPNCVVADAVINFFLGRTDKVQQAGFNPRLARHGHLGESVCDVACRIY